MTEADWIEMAREWLVRAQGYAHELHEQSLAIELRKAYERGVVDGLARQFGRE